MPDELDEVALRARRLALLDELDARTDVAPSGGPSAVELIQAAREERDDQLARGWRHRAR